jgi:protein-L-isoaspartate(D-aspartate) O-methyltransferase
MEKDDLLAKKKKLLRVLSKNKILKDKRLFQAFMEIPLEEFIPKRFQDPLKLYEDIPNLFYYSNPENYRTISAPHMITIMLQGLALEEDDDLLILGAKSGYIAALAQKLAPKGEIIILEANSEIAKLTEENLEKLGLDENISVRVKNPLLGIPELSPWQKILVTGAITQKRIYPLLKQLDPNEGVLYAPIGREFIQIYTQILRINGNYYGKRKLQVRFTPLMTKVEIDELELITDLEEIDIEMNAEKVDETLEKINIKYASEIIDEFKLTESEKRAGTPHETITTQQIEEVLDNLKKVSIKLKELKNQENVSSWTNYLDEIDQSVSNLNPYKKIFDIRTKKMQSLINQIRSFNLVRKEIDKKSLDNSELIDKKVEIIRKQTDVIDEVKEIIKKDIERIKRLK